MPAPPLAADRSRLIEPHNGIPIAEAQDRNWRDCCARSPVMPVWQCVPPALWQIGTANTWPQTPSSASALHHRCLADVLRHQPRQAIAHIISRYPFQTAIHHQPDAFDRQAGLGDVSCQHHLAPPGLCQLDSSLLLRQRQRAIQRAQIGITWYLAVKAFQHSVDFRHPGRNNSS